MNKSPSNYRSLKLLLLLNSLFFLGQLLFAVLNHPGFIQQSVHFSRQFHFPWSIFPDIILCILAQYGLYIVITGYLWWIILNISRPFNLSIKRCDQLSLSLWLLSVVSLLLANQVLYPLSQFADLTHTFIPLWLAKILLYFCLFLLTILSGIALLIQIKTHKRLSMLIGMLFLIGSVVWLYPKPKPNVINSPHKPNIIIIGIDSLRPDYTTLFAYPKNIMPHINQFMQHASNFTQAYTPLARTYPSWIGMLTGLNPPSTGARFDLINPDKVDVSQSLAKRLQGLGYATLFAIDDARFSNFNHALGFDNIISPKPGINDFILGTLNDFPVSNLTVNTFLGPYLFPYNSGNRQDLVTYKPSMFTRLIKTALTQHQQQPLLLIVHFCLPHFPYAWSVPLKYLAPPTTNQQARYLYRHALTAVDKQVADLLQFLKQQGRLKHAMVMVLSDHGEAFGRGDRLTTMAHYQANPKAPQSVLQRYARQRFEHDLQNHVTSKKHLQTPYSVPVDLAFGHGTDVLSLQQSHCLLSFRFFGEKKLPPRMQTFTQLTSMLSIKPTIETFLHLPLSRHQANSLWPLLTHQKKALPATPLFIENGYTPASLLTLNPNTKVTLENGLKYFHIDPTTDHVYMNQQATQLIMRYKSYAIIDGHWLLALVATPHKPRLAVLVNLQTKAWTDNLAAPFAKQAPTFSLKRRLSQHFADTLLTKKS